MAEWDVLKSIGSKRGWRGPNTMLIDSLPWAQLSYSMSGEDAALRRYFKIRMMRGAPGVYVDVGSARPWDISNSFLFYSAGWSGIAIDLHAEFASDWAQARPRDKFVHAAVSDVPGTAYVYKHRMIGGMDRISFDPAPPGPDFAPLTQMPTRRLSDILDEHLAPETVIQFFNIDVEGAELGVLRSNNWEKWRPEMIVMECLDFDMTAPLAQPAAAFLRDLGYRLCSCIDNNVFFEDSRRPAQ